MHSYLTELTIRTFLSLDWDKGEYVKDSQGTLASADEIAAAVKKAGADNMDFIYLDVWYQNAWETRRIAEEINSLGWRFSTEFPYEASMIPRGHTGQQKDHTADQLQKV